MATRPNSLFPCAVFFAAGQTGTGLLTLLMQLSLVFWPTASGMARKFVESSGRQRMLQELSERHRRPADPYTDPVKKFRQVA